jgi:hypothetical protein
MAHDAEALPRGVAKDRGRPPECRVLCRRWATTCLWHSLAPARVGQIGRGSQAAVRRLRVNARDETCALNGHRRDAAL